MSCHMLLSIFRHQPSARVAPLQSPILLVDNFNSMMVLMEVKHFCFPISYRSAGKPQQGTLHNLVHVQFP